MPKYDVQLLTPDKPMRRWIRIALIAHLAARAAVAWRANNARDLGMWVRAIDNAANQLLEDTRA